MDIKLNAKLWIPLACAWAFAAGAGTGCGHGAGPNAAIRSELVERQGTWIRRGILDYHYTFKWTCSCTKRPQDPVIVVVRDDVLTDLIDPLTGDGLPVSWQPSFTTIDGLFSALIDAIDCGANRVTVSFDPALGYPTAAEVDPSSQAADDDTEFTASDLLHD